MSEKKSFITFPCVFQIKVVGDGHATFIEEIIALTQQHYPAFKEEDLRHQTSKNKNYIALTLQVYATSQPELDALYLALTKHPNVKMVL